MSDLWLIRHGETAWSAAGRHTGRTDVPLTPRGERQARLLRRRLENHEFALVLTSPLRRAHDTCRLAGYSDAALVDDDLREWDYGRYEGRTTAEVQVEEPGWTIWRTGGQHGESTDAVGVRADRVIARALAASGSIALFAHAHVLRILAARWLGLDSAAGRFFSLHTASVSVLGHDGEQRVFVLWNDVSHLAGRE